MTDVSNFSEELLQHLAIIYDFSSSENEKISLETTEKGQRKLRKRVNELYEFRSDEFPEDIRNFIEKGSDTEVLSFLKNCSARYKSLLEVKQNTFDREISALDETSREALVFIFDKLGYWPPTEISGDTIKVYIEYIGSCRRDLTLKNVLGFDSALISASIENCKIIFNKDEKRYFVCGEAEHIDGSIDVNFSFEDAEVNFSVFDQCRSFVGTENPWDFLCIISHSICAKADLSADYLNEKEKRLLPLLRDIVQVQYPNFEDDDIPSLYELESLFKSHGCEEAVTLLTKFRKVCSETNSYLKSSKIGTKLFNLLSQKKYEPIWREIFEKFRESQAEYSGQADVWCDEKLLKCTREEVQRLMESKGYEGTYPDFVKYGEIKNVRLAQACNMTYFVGFEKRVKHFVSCVEFFEENDSLTIQFLCGTALLKKDDEEKDVFGCMFDSKGRRFFDSLNHRIPLNHEDEDEVCDLETAVSTAVKKAELLKLSKAEMRAYNGYIVPGFRYFLFVFLIFGGIFSIGMTLMMMLITVNITFLFGTWADVLDMLKSIPWMLILAIGWIGFGGVMGLIETLARRK